MSYKLKWIIPPMLIFPLLFHTGCQIPAKVAETSGNSSYTSIPVETPDIQAEPLVNYENAVPPISIGKVTKANVKPPEQIYLFELEFKSQQDDYKWLLMRHKLDGVLNESLTFAGREDSQPPINAKEYSGKKKQGKAVIIEFWGKDDFRAIRLPKQGSIKFESFKFYSFSDVLEIEVWAVKSLLINGKTPLEDWLPYNTTSEPGTHIFNENRDQPINLDFGANAKERNIHYPNINGVRPDYPGEKVEFIAVQGIRRWKIPYKLSVDKNFTE